MIEMVMFGIGVFVGIAIGVIGYKAIEKDVDLDTDTAIAYLKEKGYWTTINVNPNKDGKND